MIFNSQWHFVYGGPLNSSLIVSLDIEFDDESPLRNFEAQTMSVYLCTRQTPQNPSSHTKSQTFNSERRTHYQKSAYY